MTIDTTSPRTRRAILLGAIGATAASVAATVGRAQPVSAADNDIVHVGHLYSATTQTEIDVAGSAVAIVCSSESGGGLWGQSVSGVGIQGDSHSSYAVSGRSTSGTGVSGYADSGYGVWGESTSSIGVFGRSAATDNPAILGLSAGGATAVQGHSSANSSIPPAGPAKTGVYGYAAQDASARGVTGETTAGRGVNGIATTGTGVVGKSNSGEGVRGVSDGSNGTAGSSASGIASGLYGENTGGGFGTYGRSNVGAAGSGVFGESTAGTGVGAATTTGVALRATSSGTGMAMEANGRVAFSTSGLASVAVGSATKTVTPGSNLVVGSLVLCTLESGQPHLAIQRVTKNPTANTFTVYLSAPVAAGNTAKVGWFVIG